MTDLTALKTKSGKTIEDFQIPEDLKTKDPELIELIMGSESMDDAERQYWFNLWLVMNEEQVEKLRDILRREKKKLAEIEAKYAKKPELTPEEIAKKNADLAAKQKAHQESLKREEAEHQAKEAEQEENLLSELENL